MAAVLTVLASCSSTPSADQYLQNDQHRKDMVTVMVHDQPYMSALMHEMMNNDSCKQMMMDSMMNDSKMQPMMMGKTMEMCNADSSMCTMMMGAMKTQPNVMKSMKGMCDMDHMSMTTDNDHMKTEQPNKGVVYTCPMHPQIKKDKPGKCPICGMELVKKN
ncbi:MAG: heavy metal-binding domain-containing protein [Sediminibacterium sp.]